VLQGTRRRDRRPLEEIHGVATSGDVLDTFRVDSGSEKSFVPRKEGPPGDILSIVVPSPASSKFDLLMVSTQRTFPVASSFSITRYYLGTTNFYSLPLLSPYVSCAPLFLSACVIPCPNTLLTGLVSSDSTESRLSHTAYNGNRDEYREALHAVVDHYKFDFPTTVDGEDEMAIEINNPDQPFVNPFSDISEDFVSKMLGFILMGHPGIG
jgi:hypothetical protein